MKIFKLRERLYRVLWSRRKKRTNKFHCNYLIKTENPKKPQNWKRVFLTKKVQEPIESFSERNFFLVAEMKIESLWKLNREKMQEELKSFSRTFFTKIISSFLCEAERAIQVENERLCWIHNLWANRSSNDFKDLVECFWLFYEMNKGKGWKLF